MELNRLAIYEELENKSKSLELKVKVSDFDSDMALIVKIFKRFLTHEKKKRRNKKR